VRVLHVTTEFPPIIYGGLGVATGGLVKASAKAGIDVGVLLLGPTAGSSYGAFRPLSDQNPGARRRRTQGTTVFEVSWVQDFETVVRIVANWQPDLLHLHSFWVWPIAQALRERLAIPLVYTVHSLDRAEYELGLGPPQCVGQWAQQESVIFGADQVIALTRSERELLMQYCPGVSDRIRIVGNGIEDTSIPRRQPPDGKDPIVLFVGRFVERKGIRELIHAIDIVLAEAPNVKFVLAGGHRGCAASEMESWLLPPHLHRHRSRIHFTGWLSPEQTARWYRAADVLVVPSWYEPFGMVVLEGMMHGLAVAASNVGGPAEILEHGRTGLLFPPRDAQALARAIIQLATDPAGRARIAAWAADEVREQWMWPRIVEKIRSVYSEATSRRAFLSSGR
jgi:glycogen synthase